MKRLGAHKWAALCVSALLWPAASGAEYLPNSGLDARFHDMIDEAPVFRLRYVLPQLQNDAIEYDELAADMEHLCQSHAMSQLRELQHSPERIIIALMGKHVDFGVMTPDVRQFFESFSIKNGLCIWEPF